MAISTLRRHALFVAGSVLAGLAVATLVGMLWPQLIRTPAPVGIAADGIASPAVPAQIAPAVGVQPVGGSSESSAGSTVPASGTGPASTVAPPLAELPQQANYGSFAPAVRVSAPAVVSVYTQRTVAERLPASGIEQMFGGPVQPRYRQRVQRGLGSGVIVDARGHIVTNQHVIAGSDQINVQLADGRTAAARVVGRDPDTDLAVLKIDMLRLPVMALGRSDHLAVGDVVLAIGNPLGLSQTVTHGIISATGRAQLGVAVYENFIQTDAAINVGNSGGALVNVRGELIGINTAVLGKNLGAEGIGVAIPVDLVRGVMREILQHGRVIRGWIGIVAEDIAPDYVRQLGLPHAGVVVGNLYRNSPAFEAGLAIGDMIETIDGQPVRTAQDTLARIASRKPGSTVKLTGMRGQQRFAIELKVVEPALPAAK
jgi:serine protease DegS